MAAKGAASGLELRWSAPEAGHIEGPGSVAAPQAADGWLQRMHRHLQRATARALFGTFVGYLPGFILPFALAARMHIGHLTDAYSFAFGVATFAAGVFTGVLQTNILPVLQSAKRDGRSYFNSRLWQVTRQATGVVALIYAVLGGAAVVYVGAGTHWTGPQKELLLAATGVFGVFVIATSVNSMLAAAVNALDTFFSPAASQALRSLAPLAVIPFVARGVSGFLVVASLNAGGELVRTAVLLRQVRARARVIPEAPAGQATSVNLSFWRAAAPATLAILVAAAGPLVDRAVAAPLAPGSVTVLDLGERIFQVPLTILGASLILVAGTHWADLGRSDLSALRAHSRRTVGRGLVVAVALTVAILAALGVAALIVGPRFAGTSTGRLVAVTASLLAGLPGAFVIAAGARFLTATRATYLLPAFALVSFSTNLGFDLLGAHLFGVVGIALSSTVYRCVNAVLYLFIAQRLLSTEFARISLRRRVRLEGGPRDA